MKYLSDHIEHIVTRLPANRIVAIDMMRGLTIAAMILVNNPGSWQNVYGPLLHANWHGWTPTDLIFPFFIFIVGISIQISTGRQIAAQLSNRKILFSAGIRMFKLIGLGLLLAMFYYNFADPAYDWVEQKVINLRWPGVLQRIGLVYFFTVLIVLNTHTIARLFWILGLLLGYWALLLIVPYADGDGNTYAGLMQHGNSLSAWFDHLILTKAHVYYPDAQPFAFDPEGILSTFPSIATCLTGVMAGQWLQSAHSMSKKAFVLFFVGIVGVLLGEYWGAEFPINKTLWTSSYVVLSSGYACIFLSVCLFLTDIKDYTKWAAPMLVFGANSIAFYVFSGVLARLLIMIPVGDSSLKSWFYQSVFAPLLGPYNGSLAFALGFLLVSYLVLYQMYKRGIFWKV